MATKSEKLALEQRIKLLLARIDLQIEAVKKTARVTDHSQLAMLRYPDGKFIMTELLLAEAQAYDSLVKLKTSRS